MFPSHGNVHLAPALLLALSGPVLAQAPSSTEPAPASAAASAAASAPAPGLPLPSDLPRPLDASGQVKGSIAGLKGKRFYVSEYRVLFETAGSVTANTRAAYFGGTNYGATRMTIKYAATPVDLPSLQRAVDRAYEHFLARLEAAGVKPEPADNIVREHGAVYEASQEASRPGKLVTDDFNFGYGKRSYLVLAPTGMKLNPRGIAGLGAGNIGNRIKYMQNGLEAISVVVAINIAAHESSGSGSSLFRRGSSANASAAMEVAQVPMGLLQSHAATLSLRLDAGVPIAGQFASFRETGGYDTRKDTAMQGLTMLGNLMGQAVNQSKSVEMAVDLDPAATAELMLTGLSAINQAVAAAVR